MIEFKINEIPDGKSSRTIDVDIKSLDLASLDARQIQLSVEFTRNEHSIYVKFGVETLAMLQCDRSLDWFEKRLTNEYQVIFKVDLSKEEEGLHETARRLDYTSNQLDITQEVRDTILLSVPVKKLHPRFYDEHGNETEFHQTFPEGEDIDPRWEKLKEIKKHLNKN